MPASGYYRYPTLHNDTIVFVSEDDLWTVSAAGGVARRLTANLGTISHPFFSPDGRLIAFTGREEGHNEVYVMASEGGPVKRLTYLGVSSSVIGWTPDGKHILFSSDHQQPIDRIGFGWAVSPSGGEPTSYPVGHCVSISVDAQGRTVIGRNNNDPARWKRYKGGTAGDLWIDAQGEGIFKRLLQLDGNVARPMLIGERVFFLSDHDGIGNLYSCDLDGQGVRQSIRAGAIILYASPTATASASCTRPGATCIYTIPRRTWSAKWKSHTTARSRTVSANSSKRPSTWRATRPIPKVIASRLRRGAKASHSAISRAR